MLRFPRCSNSAIKILKDIFNTIHEYLNEEDSSPCLMQFSSFTACARFYFEPTYRTLRKLYIPVFQHSVPIASTDFIDKGVWGNQKKILMSVARLSIKM